MGQALLMSVLALLSPSCSSRQCLSLLCPLAAADNDCPCSACSPKVDSSACPLNSSARSAPGYSSILMVIVGFGSKCDSPDEQLTAGDSPSVAVTDRRINAGRQVPAGIMAKALRRLRTADALQVSHRRASAIFFIGKSTLRCPLEQGEFLFQRRPYALRAARAASARAGYGAGAPPECCWRRNGEFP